MGCEAMFRSSTSVRTQNGGRYLKRLCKHWSHKFDVSYTDEEGRVPFGDDRFCTFKASPESLAIEIEAPDQEAIARLEQVVTDHLIRMADRDQLSELSWSRSF